MPISTVLIDRVYPSETAKPGLRQYLVEGTNTETTFHQQFFTLNDFKASVCDRARVLRVPAVITWKDGRMRTKDIVFVELHP